MAYAGLGLGQITSTRLLRRSSQGPDVVELQNVLKTLGFFPLSVRSTGFFGTTTESAVKKAQAAARITVDGKVGPQTKATLNRMHAELTEAGPGNGGPAPPVKPTGKGRVQSFIDSLVSVFQPAAPAPPTTIARRQPFFQTGAGIATLAIGGVLVVGTIAVIAARR